MILCSIYNNEFGSGIKITNSQTVICVCECVCVYTFVLGTQALTRYKKATKPLSLRPACSTQQVPGQPRQHSKTPSQNKEKRIPQSPLLERQNSLSRPTKELPGITI